MAQKYDPDLVRENIRRLLEYRNKSSFEVSLAIGKNRTYVDDFLRGRKQGLAPSSLGPIAHALDASTVYIYGSARLPDDLSEMHTQSEWEIKRLKDDRLIRESFGQEDQEGTVKHADISTISGMIPELIISSSTYPLPTYIERSTRTYSKENVGGLWVAPPKFIEDDLNASIAYIDVVKLIDESMDDQKPGGFRQGDRLFINRLDKDILREGTFAIVESGSYSIRHITAIRGSEPLEFDCLPFNPKFSRYRLKLSPTVNIIGRVVAHLRAL